MRPILAVAILLFGASTASPEPEYFALLPGSFHLGASAASLVEIESSLGKGDRQAVAATLLPEFGDQKSTAPVVASLNGPNDLSPAAPLTTDQLCNALMSSAEDNDLPVPFFANLIWQESGLRNDVVSSKGAMGIAQFMPETAHESELANPFDPLQALSASARLLHDLRAQFGNLGLAAAAYNAGVNRVNDWLKRHRTLPRETRGYVIDVTGRSVDDWQKTPVADADLRFVRPLPCRELPAFAELEQTQSHASPPDQEKSAASQAAKPQPEKPKEADPPARAERKPAKREVKEHIRHAPHVRHKRV